jgi:hypothetical protein
MGRVMTVMRWPKFLGKWCWALLIRLNRTGRNKRGFAVYPAVSGKLLVAKRPAQSLQCLPLAVGRMIFREINPLPGVCLSEQK